MKQAILIINCCLLAAGLCLGQSDSTKTANDSVTVTVAVDKTASDSVIVIKIHAADLAKQAVNEIVLKGEQPYRAPDMTLGIRFFSLYDFPGAIFFQKQIQCGAMLGAGVNYKRGQYNSQGEYGRMSVVNRETIDTKGNAWTACVNADLSILVKQWKGWRGSAVITALYSYGKSDSTVRYVRPTAIYYFTDMSVLSEYHEVGFGLDLIIEREFSVKGYSFSAGLINPLVYFSKTKEVVKTTYRYMDNTSDTYNVDINRPWQVGMNNPLSGRVGLQIKYLFY